MIRQRCYKSNMVGELPYHEFLADTALWCCIPYLPEDFHTLEHHSTHSMKSQYFNINPLIPLG